MVLMYQPYSCLESASHVRSVDFTVFVVLEIDCGLPQIIVLLCNGSLTKIVVNLCNIILTTN